MLGGEGRGFAHMMTKLSQERLAQAIRSALVTETIIDWTVKYTSQRKAFGQTIADFQNTQFKLAELATEAAVAREPKPLAPPQQNFLLTVAALGQSGQSNISDSDEAILLNEVHPIEGWPSQSQNQQ